MPRVPARGARCPRPWGCHQAAPRGAPPPCEPPSVSLIGILSPLGGSWLGGSGVTAVTGNTATGPAPRGPSQHRGGAAGSAPSVLHCASLLVHTSMQGPRASPWLHNCAPTALHTHVLSALLPALRLAPPPGTRPPVLLLPAVTVHHPTLPGDPKHVPERGRD